MKSVCFFLALCMIPVGMVFSQVSVNSDGTAPDNSAMLDIKATDKGVLFPRMSDAVRNSIPSPAIGLVIYNTTSKHFNFYSGTLWYQLESVQVSLTTGSLGAGGGIAIRNSAGTIPENSSILDVNDPARGIRIPRTTPDLIASPASGLIIYNTATGLLNYFNGSQWVALCAISTGSTGAGGSQTAIGVAINDVNAGPHHSALLDIASPNKGLLIPRMTTEQRNLILPATGLVIYNTSWNALEYYNGTAWLQMSTTLPGAPAAGLHQASATQIVWKWNAVAGAAGYKWNITNDYASAIEMGTATEKTETGLACATTYDRYAWSYNTCGFSSAVQLSKSTLSCSDCGGSFTINHIAGTVAPVNKTTTYHTVQNIPGDSSLCWITSNLGSDHQATAMNDTSEASAGWYWQFNKKQGYKHDRTTRTPNTAWINPISEDSEWISSNDPCVLEIGNGWRLPTYTEWFQADESGTWTNLNGPWNSDLKIHAAGYLIKAGGSLYYRGVYAGFYSSTQSSLENAWFLVTGSSWCYMFSNSKAFAYTLRCVKH